MVDAVQIQYVLMDSQYLAGLQYGHKLAVEGREDEYQAMVARRQSDLIKARRELFGNSEQLPSPAPRVSAEMVEAAERARDPEWWDVFDLIMSPAPRRSTLAAKRRLAAMERALIAALAVSEGE